MASDSVDTSWKRKRSTDRCHLVSRIPAFSKSGSILFYELKFTQGRVFKIDTPKPANVYHILFGFFIRRSVHRFLGRSVSALVKMHVVKDLLTYKDLYPVGQLIVQIPEDQIRTVSTVHILTQLHRAHMRFAIAVELLMAEDWSQILNCLDIVIIDRSNPNYEEKLLYYKKLKKFAPWLVCVCKNPSSSEDILDCFNNGVDYIRSNYNEDVASLVGKDIPATIYRFNITIGPSLMQDAIMMWREIFSINTNYDNVQAVFNKHSALNARIFNFIRNSNNEIRLNYTSIKDLIDIFGTRQSRRYIAISSIYSMLVAQVNSYSDFKPADTYNENFEQADIGIEPFKLALTRGRFVELITNIKGDKVDQHFGFISGVVSIINNVLLKDKDYLINDEIFHDVVYYAYDDIELIGQLVNVAESLEYLDLDRFIDFTKRLNLQPGVLLYAYEKALLWANEVIDLFYAYKKKHVKNK